MSDQGISMLHGVLVEEEVQFTLVELSVACHADIEQVVALVEEGVLTPHGEDAPRWRFDGATFKRARAALRLARDLELGVAGVAVVLDLLDEIETLRAKLRRANLA
ncbi:chaperone modulator CbpM [Cupriavidus sp. YAF13]|uniref:chaperone modulator CbpM n=1 Tax=Cupriavidus sp. YAF13 TaxID=3233075 RepID=UPI003F91A20A